LAEFAFFSFRFQLRQHQKTHSAKLKCSMCPKEFKTRVYLDIHLRTHTGLSPYSCELCAKHFSSGSSLANHVKTHTNKEPLKIQVAKIAAVVPNVGHQIVVSEILTLGSS
jgi:general transcription factor IIIA